MHTHEYASRVYGDPASADDEDDDADAEGKPKKAGRVKKSKGKSKKSKGKSADSFGWIFDEGGGALGDPKLLRAHRSQLGPRMAARGRRYQGDHHGRYVVAAGERERGAEGDATEAAHRSPTNSSRSHSRSSPAVDWCNSL